MRLKRPTCLLAFRAPLVGALCALSLSAPHSAFPGQEETQSKGAPVVPEYHVKVAFLLTLPKFVRWPEAALPPRGTPLVVGILDARILGDAKDLINEYSAQGREYRLVSLDTPSDITETHLAFLNADDPTIVRAFLRQAQGRPILTVGETPRFVHWGGIINFTARDERIALEINNAAAREARLKIGAQLLQLATYAGENDNPTNQADAGDREKP